MMNVLFLILCSFASEAVLGSGNGPRTWTYDIRNSNAQNNDRKIGPESGEVARRWYRVFGRLNADVDYTSARWTPAPFWQAIRTLVSSINATSHRLKMMETHIMSRFGDEQDGPSNRIELEMVNYSSARHNREFCKCKEENMDSSLVTPGGGYDSLKSTSLNRITRCKSDRRRRFKRSAAQRRKDTFRYEWTKRETSEPLHSLLGPPLATGDAMTKPLTLNQSTDLTFDVTTNYELFTFPDDDRLETTKSTNPINTLENAHVPKNPFYPITQESYCAYVVACVSFVIFAVGVVGNIATMCIVCHNHHMRSISNWLIANLALWDFLLLVFCLPLVVYQQLTKDWILGDFSCKAVPYVEVVSLGVSTFTLCALCVDRYRTAAYAHIRYESVEDCGSTAAKLAIIWAGALLLALPEVMVHQLVPEDEASAETSVQRCVVRVSPELPDAAYALGLTYRGVRLWWLFGCYFCLPALFTAGGALVTARRLGRAEGACQHGTGEKLRRERRMNRAVVALAVLYTACLVPELARRAVSTHMAAWVPRLVGDLLQLASRLLLMARAAATPVLLFCLCRPFGRAFLDCCCCRCVRLESAPQRRDEDEVHPQTAELELEPVTSAQPQATANTAMAMNC